MPSRRLVPYACALILACSGNEARRGADGDAGDTQDGSATSRDPHDGDATSPDAFVRDDAGNVVNGGWDGVLPTPGDVRINEVDCDTDHVELVNVGTSVVDLSAYALSDDLTDPENRTSLSGSIEPGAYSVVALVDFGLKCSADHTFLLLNDELSDVALPEALPGGATFGRLPDGEGEFAPNDPTLGTENRAYVDRSGALFDAFATPITIALTIDDAGTGALAADPRAYVRATITLTAGDYTMGPVEIGVRLKGSLGSFRPLTQKAAFKLDADRFVAGQSFLGLTKLTLNNMVQDESSVHEYLGYALFKAAGVPVPRVGYAQVTVNGATYGTYLVLEDATTMTYLRSVFPSTLGMYEPAASTDLTPEQVPAYDVKEGDTADFSALLAIADPLVNGSRTGWYDAVGAKVDWPELLRLLAVDIANGNGDGYAYARNNYMLHVDESGKLSMLPWGIDSSFMAQLDFFRSEAHLLARCFEEPRCAEEWLQALEHVYASGSALLTPEFQARVRELGQLNSARFAGDPRWEHSASGIPAAVDATLTRALGNLAHLKSRIDCHRSTGLDLDGDGHRCELDCDDNDPTRYRGAPEVCGDQIDQSCNGVADDGETCPPCVVHPSNPQLVMCPRAQTMAALSSACADLSAAPLTIADGGENAALAAAFAPWLHEQTLFIGLSDETATDTFAWRDGSAGGYRNFVDGFPFPRNIGQGPRCAVMSESGGWRTEQCDTRMPGACER